jgi:hypothetical protein
MSQRDLTIMVLGQRGRTAEAVSRAVAAVRGGGVDADVIETLDIQSGGQALADLVQRCTDALEGDCEPVIVRVRLSAEDAALVDELPRDAQQDLLVDPPPAPCPAPVTSRRASLCACDGFGCVQCMGEACP